MFPDYWQSQTHVKIYKYCFFFLSGGCKIKCYPHFFSVRSLIIGDGQTSQLHATLNGDPFARSPLALKEGLYLRWKRTRAHVNEWDGRKNLFQYHLMGN